MVQAFELHVRRMAQAFKLHMFVLTQAFELRGSLVRMRCHTCCGAIEPIRLHDATELMCSELAHLVAQSSGGFAAER